MKMFILHGWTYTPDETWAPLLSILKERGVDFEFLHIPGLSDGTDPIWTLDEYVEWLKQKTAEDDKVILWGHSNGGRISLAFTARYPEKVGALILEDSAGIPPSGLRKLKRDVFRVLSKAKKALVSSETIRKGLYKLIRENDYSQATPNMKKTMAHMVSFDARTILQKITMPTLILWGAGDKMTPLKNGQVLHAGIASSRMVVLPEARHSPHITHPAQVVDMVLDFLNT